MTDVLEITKLSEIDLEGSPPCTMHVYAGGPFVPCGRPAVARIRNLCCTGKVSFACAECMSWVKSGKSLCSGCLCAIRRNWRMT
jgi:hypothetical protein